MIPFLDVGAGYRELRAEFDDAYRRVMDAGWFVLGKEVAAFETEFAAYCGVAHCIGVGNGLDALYLALKANGIGRGDEVIVPANTFIATWLAVTYAGATPVGVDPEPTTYNLDPNRIEEAISRRTKAVIPVHLYGQPADMAPIREVADAHGLIVIEDAAQAHGACYRGQSAGSLGHCASFSFYPGKNLGCFGDGGAITTDDDTLAERLRILRNYGSERKYHHDIPGINSRLDELQAAFLRVKLRHLDDWNQRRVRLAVCYQEMISNLPGVALPATNDGIESVWHLFVLRHARRDDLIAHLDSSSVQAQIHYPVPPHLSRAYADGNWRGGPFPIAERLAREVVSLPIGPHMTEEQVGQVSDVVRSLRQTTLRAA